MPTHTVNIEQTPTDRLPTKLRAVCTCTWRSPWRRTDPTDHGDQARAVLVRAAVVHLSG